MPSNKKGGPIHQAHSLMRMLQAHQEELNTLDQAYGTRQEKEQKRQFHEQSIRVLQDKIARLSPETVTRALKKRARDDDA